eukprot:2042472-Prorocentrum_lima.AAC.1
MCIRDRLCASKRKANEVDVEDIRRVYSLFVDVKRSTQFLMEYQQDFMFNEISDDEDDIVSNGGLDDKSSIPVGK